MKIYRVNPDGGLFRFAAMDPSKQKKGGVYEVQWRECYKISADGTSVEKTVTDVDEKHRGAGEHLILSDYFDVNDYDLQKGRTIQREVIASEEDVSKGFGQDPPSAEGVLSEREQARQQEERAPMPTVTEDAPRGTVTV